MSESGRHTDADWGWPALGVVTAFSVLFAATAWTCEDAFIDYRVAHNVLLGHGMVWNPGERVWGFTSPLWVLLLVPLAKLVGSEYAASMLLSFGCGVAALVMLCRLAGRGSAAWLVSGLLLCSTVAMDWASGGLENPLLHAACLSLLTCTRAAVDVPAGVAPRWLGMSLCAGLLACTRIDAALFVAPCFALAIAHHRAHLARWPERLRLLRAGLVGASPFIAWEVFALVYFGDLIPNTARAKLPAGVGLADLAPLGATYMRVTMAWDPATAVLLLLGAASAFLRPIRWGLAAVAAIVLANAYVLCVGGDYMAGRFSSASSYFVAGALALWLRDRRAAGAPEPARLLRSALVLSSFFFVIMRIGPSGSFSLERSFVRFWVVDGIADERSFYFHTVGLRRVVELGRVEHPWGLAAVHGARRLPEGAVLAKSNIGIYGWFIGDRAKIVDMLALNSPFLARMPTCPAVRPGHFRRLFPRGFFLSEASGQARLSAKILNDLWMDTQLVTRGDLLGAGRLAAIARLSSGHYAPAELAAALAQAGNEDFPPRVGDASPITCDTPILTLGAETYLLAASDDQRLMVSQLP